MMNKGRRSGLCPVCNRMRVLEWCEALRAWLCSKDGCPGYVATNRIEVRESVVKFDSLPLGSFFRVHTTVWVKTSATEAIVVKDRAGEGQLAAFKADAVVQPAVNVTVTF